MEKATWCLYVDIYIYIVKRRRPCFVGGAIKIPSIDWLIDWLIDAEIRNLIKDKKYFMEALYQK